MNAQQARSMTSTRLREPIPVGPFLEWCAERERQIAAMLDSLPGLSHIDSNIHPQRRLLMELGWDDGAGERRLHRWRNDNLGGLVERSTVEDALHRAGIPFDLIYPLEAGRVRKLRIRLGEKRRMTDREVVAAHTIYVRARMSTTTLAELIYERFGYANVDACAKALSIAFKGLGLPVRQCVGANVRGDRCGRPPMAGSDYCPEHVGGLRPSEVGGRRSGMARTARAYHLPSDLIAKARELHLSGMSMRAVGRELLPLVPWDSADHLAQRLADAAHEQGWHLTSNYGRPRKRVGEAGLVGGSRHGLERRQAA